MSRYEYNKPYAQAYLLKFDRIEFKVPKGQRQRIKDYADRHGESVNSLLLRLVSAELDRDLRPE